MPEWELALGVEFVAQVVQRIGLAVRIGAEGGPGGCDEVVKVGERAGQPDAEPADLGSTGAGIVSSALASLPMAEAALSWRLATS